MAARETETGRKLRPGLQARSCQLQRSSFLILASVDVRLELHFFNHKECDRFRFAGQFYWFDGAQIVCTIELLPHRLRDQQVLACRFARSLNPARYIHRVADDRVL